MRFNCNCFLTATTTQEIQESTYQNNDNPYWYLYISSENLPNHPIEEALRGTTRNFASFQVGDQNPEFTIFFHTGPHTTLLHRIEGQLTTKYSNTRVTILAFNGNSVVSRVVRPLTNRLSAFIS